jgi:hypothetical protein
MEDALHSDVPTVVVTVPAERPAYVIIMLPPSSDSTYPALFEQSVYVRDQVYHVEQGFPSMVHVDE